MQGGGGGIITEITVPLKSMLHRPLSFKGAYSFIIYVNLYTANENSTESVRTSACFYNYD